MAAWRFMHSGSACIMIGFRSDHACIMHESETDWMHARGQTASARAWPAAMQRAASRMVGSTSGYPPKSQYGPNSSPLTARRPCLRVVFVLGRHSAESSEVFCSEVFSFRCNLARESPTSVADHSRAGNHSVDDPTYPVLAALRPQHSLLHGCCRVVRRSLHRSDPRRKAR